MPLKLTKKFSKKKYNTYTMFNTYMMFFLSLFCRKIIYILKYLT